VTATTDRYTAPGTKGRVLHWAAGYDLLAWLALHGREQAFREHLVTLARVAPGDAVLDIGCGTGSLAIAAKRRVGASGAVSGIDASPEMIARARRKAAKARLDVTFSTGVVEALAFTDRQFDAVLSTLMLHHLPREPRRRCMVEVHRVLKPGGRMLAVDFVKSSRGDKGLIRHFHRHGHVDMRDIVRLSDESGFSVIESGEVGVRNLSFVLLGA
jgi:ubiquinone/menaquinone biosynthesis C-methylase UbiE